MISKTRRYATVKHPSIEALVHGLYRYKDKAQAIARLASITAHFVLSKEQPESTAEAPAALLWIKGFEVTEDEAAKGFTGQFALVQITQMDNGLFTLTATRVEKPIATHPQKKRLQSKHPNWGHPVMRAVKKQKGYDTLDAANAELELLHTEFPEVSIPGLAKLYIIIYEKREGISRPTHKIALEIVTHTEGGYVICARDNEKPAKPKLTAPSANQNEPSADAQSAPGYFASLVALKNKKRRRNIGRPSTPHSSPDDNNEA